MISARHHAISIAAIFIALAVGVLLGSQTLASGVLSGLRGDRSDLQQQVDGLQNTNNQLVAQLGGADGFDSAVAGRIVRDTLIGRTVVVVTTPDADSADVDAISRTVSAAGGSVIGKVALTAAFLDPSNADRLRTTVTNIVPAGVQLRTGAIDQGSLAGDLLGSVLLLAPATALPQSTPEDMTLALDTLRSGGFLEYDATHPAQLAVVVTGDFPGAETSSSGALIARLAASLDNRGAGAVLAGRPGSAVGAGPIAFARSDSGLASTATTVDNLDREAGQITVTLALAEQLTGGTGRYGTGPNATAITVGAEPANG